MNNFLNDLSNLPNQPEENAFNSIWNQYERVILESLLSAFLLDFLITDQHGGDVDTINNVRQVGSDPQMTYKNAANQAKYDARGEYSHKEVEGTGTNFQRIKHDARSAYGENPRENTVKDAYTNRELHFLGKSKGHPTEKNANLDHVVAAKTVHEDRGRVLSGLSTRDVADIKENLAWTNEKLNKSLGDTDKETYVNEHPELSEDIKKNLIEKEKAAKEAQNRLMFQAYYLDPSNPQCRQFYKDATLAAGKLGIKMGIRQALGFVFVEVYIVTKQEVQNLAPGCDYSDITKAVAVGLKKGFESALSKYKEIIAKFGEGLVAGGLASLCTTLCNIFFATGKFFIKNIREILSCIIRSTRVLLLNPEDLELGDRLKLSSVVLATGASVLAGSYVGVKLAETPIAEIPIVGDMVIRFCSTLVSGLLSCTFLIFMDRSEFMNKIVDALNTIPSEVTDMKEISAYLEMYAAELYQIDIAKFRKDSEQYEDGAVRIINARDEQELSIVLNDVYKTLELPWKGDFDDFMGNKDNHLVFE